MGSWQLLKDLLIIMAQKKNKKRAAFNLLVYIIKSYPTEKNNFDHVLIEFGPLDYLIPLVGRQLGFHRNMLDE